MSTQTKEKNKTEDSHEHEGPGHVHGAHCNHHRLAPIIRETPKVGRNDECPCGSKKKYKKCCGN